MRFPAKTARAIGGWPPRVLTWGRPLRWAPVRGRNRGALANSLRACGALLGQAPASQCTKRAARAAPVPAVTAAPQCQPRRDAATARRRRPGGWDKFVSVGLIE